MKQTAPNDKQISMLDCIKRQDDELTSKFSESMQVNPNLDRTLVSFQANKQKNGHRWCKYKEGFSADLIRYILNKCGIKHGRILDPFAGSGTTLFVASESGIDSVGIELLPNSTEIIEVRKVLIDIDKPRIAASIRDFASSHVWESPGKRLSFPHINITSGAFPEETEKAIGRYLYEVNKVSDALFARALRFACMCVLESVSYTRKDGQCLRWDWRSGRRSGGKEFKKGQILSFGEAIETKLNQIADDLDPHGFLNLFEGGNHGNIDLMAGSCLTVLPSLQDNSFDGLITSPPYCNRYDYTRTYALELAFLGIDEVAIKELRQTMLSCTVESRPKPNLDKDLNANLFEDAMKAFSGQMVLSSILDYLEECRKNGSINNTGIPRMVRNYFLEMSLVLFESARVLKEGAPFVMVNDNVRYQGAHVPVDLILSEFAEKAGFQVESIWVLPKGKGNSSQQMAVHGREEIRKCVYVWRKPKQIQAQDASADTCSGTVGVAA